LTPRLSSDDQRVLLVAQGDLRVFDLATGRESRVTSDGATGAFAEWGPEDRTIAYSSTRSGPSGAMNAWIQPADGTGTAMQLTSLDGQVHVDSWTPNGRLLAVHQHKPGGATDAFIVPVVDGTRSEPRPYLAEPFAEQHAVFSPDGRYVAYQSNETGQLEAYIRPFPGPGPKTPVSVGGADELGWSRTGDLFFRRLQDNALMVVPVGTNPTLAIGRPKELFRLSGSRNPVGARRYAVSADGTRLLLSASLLASGADAASRPSIHIVLNWHEELTRLVPTK
jgi:Tol biopolymer transport system component